MEKLLILKGGLKLLDMTVVFYILINVTAYLTIVKEVAFILNL